VLDESENTVAVIDFGICAETSEDRVVLTTLNEGFGNRSFAAPECEAGSPDRGNHCQRHLRPGKATLLDDF